MNKTNALVVANVTLFLTVPLVLWLFAAKLDRIEGGVEVRNTLLGKARYLPGAACVISTTAEQTPADIVNFARACAKAHEMWLEEQVLALEGGLDE